MLTPDFELKQDEDFIIVLIRCPYIKFSEVEFYISGTEFKFFAKPYFLSLSLPGEIVDDSRATSKYDVDNGEIVAVLPKKVAGEHFEDLGMLTKLLSKPKHQTSAQSSRGMLVPQIEVLSSSCSQDSTSNSDDEDFDWCDEQTFPTTANKTEEKTLLFEVSYGFAGKYNHVLEKLQGEVPNIVDVPDPDHMSARERHEARLLCEDSSFSADHYLADLMDNAYLKETILTFQPQWKDILKTVEKSSKPKEKNLSVCCSTEGFERRSVLEPDSELMPFTQKHLEILKRLPRKEYLLDKSVKRSVYLGLVDIMLAYAYNYITTEGENTVESAWTICKLSASLSWLQVYSGNLHEVVLTFFRRSLCFPLYRHWNLSQKAVEETKNLFSLGRRKLLICLLEIHQLLSSSDPYYVLNDIFISDYCVWIQHASASTIASMSEALDKCVVSMDEVQWELVELEEAARLTTDEPISTDTEED